MLCPMHIPVLLCGFLCGWQWGLVVGMLSPLLRSLLFHMPVLYPMAVGMLFELAVYGAVSGLLYSRLPKKPASLYVTLLTAMVSGRVIWGIVRYAMFGLFGTAFSMKLFLSGAVLTAWPGIVLQILLIPPLVMALEKSGFCAEAQQKF